MRIDIPVPQTPDLYDHYTGAFTKPWDDILIDRVVDEWQRLGLSEGTLVDVGTGTAVLMIQAARRPELKGLKMIGLDYFPNMVEKAREMIDAAGLTERIAVQVADAQATGLPDGCADLIMSRATMHHLREPETAYREMHRLLKPHGVAVIHDMRRDPDPEAFAQFNELRQAAGIGPTILEQKYTLAEVKQQIHAAGLDKKADVYWGESGPAALGYEVRIRGGK